VNPSLQWLAELDESQFEQLFNGSPIRRAGYQGLRRNIAIAMGNSGLAHFLPCSISGLWPRIRFAQRRAMAVAKLQSEATPPNPSD